MAVDMISRPIYDRKYSPLRRLSWAWRSLATYASFITWLFSTPWLAVRQLAPNNFQDTLSEMERSFLDFVTPFANFAQDTSYKAFSIADSTIDWTINTASHIYQNNLKGFEHTFDHFLNNVEHRVRILKDDGLSGIGKALSYDVHTPLIQKTPLAHTTLGEKLS
ncbi:hypothetical protein CHLRE_12g491550v5 [Chlamydomonas reinhardtii]|uniref:Uncharacterized protein n=1 Tax=Chlamydomonas reinhardtii TaxID=3055 RepID=A8ILT4_CHLRE|nr:uncharacterized protein CHLRE_12g491550v5 [Chlamydomonas reinhardtii]PNW74588.1 hypothetical protein CHLRE_12g491550v5 [Chlamydomonas reinhardtii]|eukprot:XP_001690946.1 predicted protein [Chlamydomonas reinhardtii]